MDDIILTFFIARIKEITNAQITNWEEGFFDLFDFSFDFSLVSVFSAVTLAFILFFLILVLRSFISS